MSVIGSMDTKSFVAVQWADTGSYIPFHCLAGTSAVNDPGLQKVFLAGNSSFEAINFLRGLSQPVVDVVTIPHKNWFNSVNLRRMLTGRDSSTGFLSSIGHVNYRVGSGVGGVKEVEGTFDKSYVSTFLLSGQGRGTPLSCRMGLLPAGSAGSVAAPTGITPGSTGFFMSDGVQFGSDPGVTDVLGWSLTVMNNFGPDTSLAGADSVPFASDLVFPSQYLSGPIGVMFSITQKSDAESVYDDTDNTSIFTFGLTLKSVEAAGGDSPEVVPLTIRCMRPTENAVVQMGLSSVTRNYIGIATAAGLSLVI